MRDRANKAHHKQPPPIIGADHLPPLCHTPRAARLRALKCVHHGASENMLTAGTGALQNSGERVVATRGNCLTTKNQETPCTAFPPSRVDALSRITRSEDYTE